jgi:acyl carrier protein
MISSLDKTTEIRKSMANILRIPVTRIEDNAVLTDLVTDSFALIDMVIELQDEYDVVLVQNDLKDVKTVGDLLAAIQRVSATEKDTP